MALLDVRQRCMDMAAADRERRREHRMRMAAAWLPIGLTAVVAIAVTAVIVIVVLRMNPTEFAEFLRWLFHVHLTLGGAAIAVVGAFALKRRRGKDPRLPPAGTS
jgi:hypothetical protein